MTAINRRANAKNTKEASAGKKWSRARTRKSSSPTGISANAKAPNLDTPSADRIERLLEQKRWSEARAAIIEELQGESDSHWLLTMLGLTHYEQKHYDASLRFTKSALVLNPECPLVLFHYAGTLAMLGRVGEALGVYQQLLGRGLGSVANDECGEGLDWAMGLLNDCHYRMARCYEFSGDKKAAQLSYLKYLHNRSHGVASIYEIKKAEAGLAAVSQVMFHVAANGTAKS